VSDDTPTQRYPEGFPPPGGTTPPGQVPPAEPGPLADAPTERFGAPLAQPGPATIPLADEPHPAATVPPAGTVPPANSAATGGRGNRGLIITLAVIAGVLLLALIGLLIWVAVNSGAPSPAPTDTTSTSPSPTPTESESPSPSPTPTETEAHPPPPPANVITSYTASTQSVDCSGGGPVPVTFSWATTGVTLWFGVGTSDAHAEPVDDFPLNYTMDFDYQCGQTDKQQRYTITVQRQDGSFQSQTIVIRET